MSLMWAGYIYEHRRQDTGAVFYVGKGTFRKNRPRRYERLVSTADRSVYWQRVVSKAGGFTSEVVAHAKTREDACDIEIQRIAFAKRLGWRLVNLTDGGEGRRNGVVTEAERQKRRIAASGPRSEAWKQAMRAARKNGGNGGVVKHGDRLPESWKRNIAKARLGAMNPMFGRTGAKHHNARQVRDEATGALYESVTAAAFAIGMRLQTLHARLTGGLRNHTSLRLVNG